eukprot:scaffold8569_cov139-Cylindrotheca_fusiformis.AAC.10
MSDRTWVTVYHTENNLSPHQTTSISKHYALNNQILAAFESHYRNGMYDLAFCFGLKFAETALLHIPKHGYFYSKKHEKERVQSTTDSIRVTHLLQQIIAEGPESLAKECHKVERLNHLATVQFENLNGYDEERQKVEQELYLHGSTSQSNDVHHVRRISRARPSSEPDCMSSTLLACGDSFSSLFCPSASSTAEATQAIKDELQGPSKRSVSFPEPGNAEGSTASRSDSFPESGHVDDLSFPRTHVARNFPSERPSVDESKRFPPLTRFRQTSSGSHAPAVPRLSSRSNDQMPPPPPAHVRSQSDLDLDRALFLSGLKVALQDEKQRIGIPENGEDPSMELELDEREQSPGPAAPPGAVRRQSSGAITTEMLTSFLQQDFLALKKKGRVRISQVSTYQGKHPASTNGCTIIAPVTCIHHFHNENSIPDPGLPDRVIEHILDEEIPSMLPTIRKNLGLHETAFLIPSDAHEALMNQELLSAEQFKNVLGGNILQEAHLRPLLDELATVGEKKIAATFFFHEHVVTILQLRRGAGVVWFDIVDSLPHEETLCRGTDSSRSGRNIDNASRISADDQFRIASDFSEGQDIPGVLLEGLPDNEPAMRMRCLDVEALRVALQWYACSVFSAEDASYIDTYQWDENLADFDPRVFQAFVWSEA